MKGLFSKNNLMCALGFLMARAVFDGFAMVGMGFFSAMFLDKKHRKLIPIFMGIGLLTSLPIVDALKYGIIIAVITVLVTFLEFNKVVISPIGMATMTSVVTMCITVTNGLMSVTSFDYYMRLAGEGVAIFALVIIFRKGIEAILYEEGSKQIFSNEQVISLVLMYALSLYGIPELQAIGISLHVTLVYFVILYIGYFYGAGYGSLIGAVSGIILFMQSGQVADIGLYCILGIVAGTFREFGKFITSIIYMTGIILLGEFLGDSRIDVGGLGALLSCSILFVMLPIGKRVGITGGVMMELEEDIFVKHNMQSIARSKLREFSDSFLSLSNTFHHLSNRETVIGMKDSDEIFQEVSAGLCKDCSNCNLCWNQHYYDTFEGASEIVKVVKMNGTIQLEQIPASFVGRCINLDNYISETRRLVDIAKVNLYWHNKMAESRELIAGQLTEVAHIINDFSLDLYKNIDISESKKRLMLQQLSNHNIEVSKIALFEKRNGKLEAYITCRMEKGTCITTKEAATYVSEVVGKKVRPLEVCKNVISREFETFVFVEDVTYKTLTGTARITKNGERISGDNYSYIQAEPGTMVMTISDGMGSGENAYEESESVVELLERFMEAGFKKESAIKLINSILVLRTGEQSFSTIDLSVMNLYSGNCDFIKIGASSTFIKHHERVEVINSTSLPVGVIEQVEYDVVSRHLVEDSYIIMVTDGVIDSIEGDNKELILAEFISKEKHKNPNDIANQVLNFALEQNNNIPIDDMTVLVAGFWRK